MNDYLAALDRLEEQHIEALGAIHRCHNDVDAIARAGVAAEFGTSEADRLRALEEDLAALNDQFSEHMRFEEQQLLPILNRYAAQIVTNGLVFQHQAILASIGDLIEAVRALRGTPASETAMGVERARVQAKLQDFQSLLEAHTEVQRVIFELAREAHRSASS